LRALARRERRALPLRHGPRAARRLPPGVGDALAHPAPRGRGARRRPAHPLDHRGLPDQRLARARDLGLLRDHLRRAPRARAHRDARRLARPPPAQGLPAGWHQRRAQGRAHPARSRSEVVLVTTSTQGFTEEAASGARSFEATGGDWSDIAEEAARLGEERIVVNMGPQHPSTHGVLRLMLEIDGETVTEARCGIGYLHTGIEKTKEHRTWTQGVPLCTRVDYLAPLCQEQS